MGKQNPHVKPPLDQLKAVVKDWPESFKMKDELIRVLEQMLSFQSVDRPTAEQLQLLPLLGRYAVTLSTAISKTKTLKPFAKQETTFYIMQTIVLFN
jgi:hypothetical protein